MPEQIFRNQISRMVSEMNECGKEKIPFLFSFNYEMDEGIFIKDPLQQTDVYFQLNGIGNKPSVPSPLIDRKIRIHPVSPENYKEKFDIVESGIRQEKSFLTNLTVRTPIEISASLFDIFLSNHEKYQLYVPGRFVCFSPECFVKIKDGVISSYPMKGTIDASVKDAESVLLNDFKEIEEHKAAVELLINDLSVPAKDIRIERFRYIDRVKTSRKEILQVSSEVTGTLAPDYSEHLGDIILGMLPAGSICGAPKTSTLELIRQAEKEPRGFYTGIFGYYDGETLDSGVLIRFIEEENGNFFFRSGGGITEHSHWEKEYEEVLNKIYLPL